MKSYYVYILLCADKKYYVGVTRDLALRFAEHEKGRDNTCYTFHRRPVVLKYFEETNDVHVALNHEKQLKGWSRRKKEALIEERYSDLPLLSASNDSLPRVMLSLSKHDAGEDGCRPSTGSG